MISDIESRPRCRCHDEPMYKNGTDWGCPVKGRAKVRAYAQRNKEKIAEKNRRRYGKGYSRIPRGPSLSRYGITKEEYLALRERQDSKCAICASPDSDIPYRGLAIDHDHKTGHIRGLLCRECNIGLGLLGDTAEHLERALHYLREAKS